MEHKKHWDEEKEIRMKARAKVKLIEAADSGNVAAAKIIYEDKKPTRGRPSKAEKEAKLKQETKFDKKISSITDRMKKVDGQAK
jgi:hypothetical protein